MLTELHALNATKGSMLIQPLDNANLVILSAQLIQLIHPMSVQPVMLVIESLKEIVLSYQILLSIFPTQVMIPIVKLYLFS